MRTTAEQSKLQRAALAVAVSDVTIRPIVATDREALARFLHRMSARSLYLRFFAPPDLDRALDYLLDLDDGSQFGVIALPRGSDEVIAQAAYVRCGDDRAELSFLVADAWQHHGIATAMLHHLARVAAERGISRFVADVLPVNRTMIRVFRASGFAVTTHTTRGIVEIELPTSTASACSAWRTADGTKESAVPSSP